MTMRRRRRSRGRREGRTRRLRMISRRRHGEPAASPQGRARCARSECCAFHSHSRSSDWRVVRVCVRIQPRKRGCLRRRQKVRWPRSWWTVAPRAAAASHERGARRAGAGRRSFALLLRLPREPGRRRRRGRGVGARRRGAGGARRRGRLRARTGTRASRCARTSATALAPPPSCLSSPVNQISRSRSSSIIGSSCSWSARSPTQFASSLKIWRSACMCAKSCKLGTLGSSSRSTTSPMSAADTHGELTPFRPPWSKAK